MNKKKLSLIITTAIIVLVIIFLLIPLVLPETIINLMVNNDRKKAGLIKKSVQIDKEKIAYLEGGNGNAILLLHGLGADKDNWANFAKYLTPNYHVIAIDLPGFGESTKLEDAKYDVISQIERLDKFANKINFPKFHIIGNSMGGNIAAAYAINHPDKIITLCLMDNSGITAPNKSEFIKLMEQKINIFDIQNANDYKRLMSFVFLKPPQIPDFILNYIVKQSIKNAPFNNKIMLDLITTPYPLEPNLNKVLSPCLIIWGKNDRLLDISSVSVMESKIKNYKTILIDDCAHVPMIEKPQETAKGYLDFIAKY